MVSLIEFINEKYGEYEGQFEFSEALASSIMELDFDDGPYDLSNEDLFDFKNIFFENLHIVFTSNNNAYIPNKSKINKETGLFHNVELQLNKNELTSNNDCLDIVNHEMLHAWNDYKMKLKDNVSNLQTLTKQGTSYSKTIPNDFDNDIQQFTKEMLNALSGIEQNAYFSELAIILKKHNKKNISFEEARKLIENSEVWVKYRDLEYAYKLITNGEVEFDESKTLFGKDKRRGKISEKHKIMICTIFNNIYNTNKNPDSVIKYIDSKWKKLHDKLNKRKCQIYFDWIESNNEK